MASSSFADRQVLGPEELALSPAVAVGLAVVELAGAVVAAAVGPASAEAAPLTVSVALATHRHTYPHNYYNEGSDTTMKIQTQQTQYFLTSLTH